MTVASKRQVLQPSRVGTFGERLVYLFETVHAPGEPPYRVPEVVRAIRAAGGTISTAYVRKLLYGERIEPSLRVHDTLARFFGVPRSWFLEEDPADIDSAALDLAIRLRGESTHARLTTARRLTPGNQAALGDIVTGLLRAGGVEPLPAADLDPLSSTIASATRLRPESLAALDVIMAKLIDAQAPGGRRTHSTSPPVAS